MNKNLILAVALCFLFTGGVFAQSGSKTAGSSSKTTGSSSRNAGSSSRTAGSSSRTAGSYSENKANREVTREKEKLVSRMTRKDFADVRLSRDQKQTLMKMVDAKYSMISELNGQIAATIPSNKVRSLQKAFREAKKDGNSEVKAMSVSMEAIGLSETVQEKVMMINQSRETIYDAIRGSVAESFDQEQQQAFAASMMAKKEMMEKEGMMAKEEMAKKEMSGEKEMMEKEGMTEKKMSGEEKMMDKEAMMEKDMKVKEMASNGSGSK